MPTLAPANHDLACASSARAAVLEATMSAPVPRDIARKLEQRWSARFKQAETFHSKTEQLKRSNTALVEGVQRPVDRSSGSVDLEVAPITPAMPVDED